MPPTWRAIGAGVVAVLGLSTACNSGSLQEVAPSPHRVTVTGISLGRGRVSGLAFDGGTIWVCSEVQGIGRTATLSAVDPDVGGTPRPSAKLRSCGLPLAALGYLWIDGYRVDPATGRMVALPFEGQPEAFLDGSLWMSGQEGLVRIDPATSRIQAVIFDQPMDTFGRVVGMDGSVWFAVGDRVFRVDSATNEVVATVTMTQHMASAMAAGEGSLWVAIGGEGTLLRIDPATDRISATISSGAENLLDVVVAHGAVWAVGLQTIDGNSRERLWEIDPRTNRVVGRAVTIPVSGHAGVVAAAGSLWVGDGGACRDAGPPRARLFRIDIAP
ncbi:MAG: hypothetical protein AB1551_07965 [Actinomycetota bacterium]